MHVKLLQSSWTLFDPMKRVGTARLFSPWDFPGKNSRVLQGILPEQGLNLNLLHCRGILHH